MALLTYKYTGIIHNDLHESNILIIPNRRSPFGDYTPLIIDFDSCSLTKKNTPGVCIRIINGRYEYVANSIVDGKMAEWRALPEAAAVDATITYFASLVLPAVPAANFCDDDFWQMKHVSFFDWWCSKVTELERISHLMKLALRCEPVLYVTHPEHINPDYTTSLGVGSNIVSLKTVESIDGAYKIIKKEGVASNVKFKLLMY